ncbi:D-beta-hydroxybutyrate dehydrogenase, mitochondrial-like [Ruditapes philippinarum]|uniref:D-beta-hydroxybutyrate dehydrogenase, mitochondrial-like n=1 Tax=Ruditapes philippinarum TaxID=129788 RepID=UPI00295B7245|nr:D-beta-hydroxybutyrate dehydrogenase, mitochondrial-like [Ruditapes philippinarum]
MDVLASETLLFSSFMLVIGLLIYYIVQQVYFYMLAIILLCVVYKLVSKRFAKKIDDVNGKGILITGCDTGIGYATALRLCKAGFYVFAGCLNPDCDGAKTLKEKGGERLQVVSIDVTDDESIKQALETTRQGLPGLGLWAVINNAGIELAAEIEFASIEMMKHVADVNFYGMVRVTKAFLPLIRKTRGRVVNVTSAKGRLPWPADTAYVSSKYAGEAFSDILRREMYRFGVKVAIIEPGKFSNITGILQGERLCLAVDALNQSWELASEEIKEAYGRRCIDDLITAFRDDYKLGPESLDPVTDAMLDAVANVNPKCRYLVHGTHHSFDKYCILALLNQYLPEPLFDHFSRWILPLPPVNQQV